VAVVAGVGLAGLQADPPDGKAEPTVPMVPAGSLIAGKLNSTGYTLIYGSQKTAVQAATMFPPLGDSMPAEATGPMQSERPWPGMQSDNQPTTQSWTAVTAPMPRPTEAKRRKR